MLQGLLGWHNTSVGGEASSGLLREAFSRWRAPRIVTAEEGGDALAVSGEGQASEGRLFLAFLGRIHGLGTAPLDPRQPAEAARRLLARYREIGPGFVAEVRGAFSLAVIDMERKRVLLALDRLGQMALYHAETPDGLIFSHHLGDLLRHPDIRPGISAQALYDYVYYHHCPSPGTIYRHIGKLEGGQYLLFENGKGVSRYYWQPQFATNASLSRPERQEQLLTLLGEAVRRDALDAARTGAFLSGGLDSSTVSGLLAGVYPDQCNTFSIGFPVPGYDETEYARTAVERFHTLHHEFILQPEHTVDAINEIAAFYDEPFGNSSALPALFCARLASEHGVERMLAGDGGDELFAGNERYRQQLLFERYGRVPQPLRRSLEGVLNSLPAGLSAVKPIHKARRYVEQANTPLPDRLQDYNFLHRHAAGTVFDPGFLEEVDTEEPLELLREAYHRPGEADPLNRMLFMDWKTTLHDNDLVKVNQMCELAGVEVAYPMLDDAVVDFSMEIPSAVKMEGGRLRGFYKDAVKGFLPDKIINKSKHGFGLPFGIWMADYQPLRELAYDSIAGLKGKGWLRDDFLDHAVEMHRTVHAAYYGELIWILMMLERWLSSHAGAGA